jgi:hypothetical protein
MARLLSALVAVVLLGGFAPAEDKKADDKKADDKKGAPSGVWTKKTDEGLTLQLDFTKKDTLLVTNSVDDKQLIITCKLSVDNDFPVTVSDKFEMTFKLKVEKDKATVSDFGANEHEEQAKGVVEGEYKKNEDK